MRGSCSSNDGGQTGRETAPPNVGSAAPAASAFGLPAAACLARLPAVRLPCVGSDVAAEWGTHFVSSPVVNLGHFFRKLACYPHAGAVI